MFKRMMKGGQKKPSKSDSNDGYGPPANDVNQSAAVVVPPPSGKIEPLPLFRDVPVSERQNLFLRKLQICCHTLDFTDTMKSVWEKEIKRQTLMELVEFIQSSSSKKTKITRERGRKFRFSCNKAVRRGQGRLCLCFAIGIYFYDYLTTLPHVTI
ncbi:unnamed protein product [Lathyrus oleraceus]